MRFVLWRGPMALPFVLAIWAIAGIAACAHDPMTPMDQAHVSEESADDAYCLRFLDDAGHKTSAEQACRAQVKARWDSYWSQTFRDGGAE